MFLVVTPLYIALAAVLLVVLSIRVILLRRKFRIGLGDRNEPLLKKAVRVQGNFIEYVPLALLMLLAVELTGGQTLHLHLLGSALLLGRVLHAWGVGQLDEKLIWRQLGMLITFLSLLVSAGMLLHGFVRTL